MPNGKWNWHLRCCRALVSKMANGKSKRHLRSCRALVSKMANGKFKRHWRSCRALVSKMANGKFKRRWRSCRALVLKWQMANLRGIDVPAGLWYGGRSLQQHGTLPTWQGGEEDYVRSHIWDLSSLVIYLVRCQTCFQDLKVDMNDQQRLERKSKATPALRCSSFSICRRRCEMWDVPKTGCIVIVPDDAV